jgi:hypothetical protein
MSYVVYQVTLRVDRDVADEYGAWLGSHMREVAAIEGFEGASWLEPEARLDPGEADSVVWVLQYRLRDRSALDRYLREDASRMREAGTRRFGGRFSATREVFLVRDDTA